MMSQEQCVVEPRTHLTTALQQRYEQLEEPQCTNLTYINAFRFKMLRFLNDSEIRDIVCHLGEAASYRNGIHVSTKYNNEIV